MPALPPLPPRAIVGMVHLLPLPGTVRERRLARTLDRAARDARALERGGADAVLVENFGDSPFLKGPVGPQTVAAMARCVQRVRETVGCPVGVNVLRNDGPAAVALASVCGADFVRVNVLSGVMATDQGIIEGCAAEVAAMRKLLRSRVKVLADVFVKHAQPVRPRDIAVAAQETLERGGAHGLIVTGPATGRPAAAADLDRVRRAAPRAPLFLGSGVTSSTVRAALSLCDGVIVGTAFKRGGRVTNPVDVARVKNVVAAAWSKR